jgi:predicted MFS family arabinose efflux permease
MLHENYASKTFIYYLLAVVGSLSTTGTSMALLTLSASFYTFDQEGVASSSIYTLHYLGVGIVVFAGGWILQRFTAVTLGIVGRLLVV